MDGQRSGPPQRAATVTTDTGSVPHQLMPQADRNQLIKLVKARARQAKTATTQRGDVVSVTSPGALSREPPARCHQCGAPLARKHRGFFDRRTVTSTNYRKGARWCSNACRQKAYRRRQASTPDSA